MVISSGFFDDRRLVVFNFYFSGTIETPIPSESMIRSRKTVTSFRDSAPLLNLSVCMIRSRNSGTNLGRISPLYKRVFLQGTHAAPVFEDPPILQMEQCDEWCEDFEELLHINILFLKWEGGKYQIVRHAVFHHSTLLTNERQNTSDQTCPPPPQVKPFASKYR